MPGAMLPPSLATQAARSTRLPPTMLAVQMQFRLLQLLQLVGLTATVATIG